MVKMELTLKDLSLKREIREMLTRVTDLTPAMRVIGELVRSSIQKTFQVGGRPERWKPLSDVTLSKRRNRKKSRAKPLLDTGRLLNSITRGVPDGVYEVYKRHVRVGTNVIYAAVHQFGARKGSFGTMKTKVRAHLRRIPGKRKRIQVREHYRKITVPWGDIPARPFMVIQQEDIEDIGRIFSDFIYGK